MMIEWIQDPPPSTPGGVFGLGATAQNPMQYADCNIAKPTEAGKQIITKLQKFLQQQVPGSRVLQTGFLDAETCAAWREYTRDKKFMGPYPQNFNIHNILDTVDGASVAGGKVVHHWKCNGPIIFPPCDQVPPRTGDADPCPDGQQRNSETGACEDIVCPEGQIVRGKKCVAESCPGGYRLNLETGDCDLITCPEGQMYNLEAERCEEPQPVTTKGKRKSGGGLLLLAGAALGAIILAVAT